MTYHKGFSGGSDNKESACNVGDLESILGYSSFQFSSVQSLSRVRLFVTPWIAARQASLSITNPQSSLKLMSIESVLPSSHLLLCRPLLILPPIPPSIRVFSNESTLRMRWPKYWSFSFSIILSKEHPGLISCRMDWSDLLAVQGTPKSLLQHHSSKASILQHSAFFTVQFSHPYMTTGKTKALTRWTFVGKVMSLLFNMLSRLVITFLPRSNHSSILTWRILWTEDPGGLYSPWGSRSQSWLSNWHFHFSRVHECKYYLRYIGSGIHVKCFPFCIPWSKVRKVILVELTGSNKNIWLSFNQVKSQAPLRPVDYCSLKTVK